MVRKIAARLGAESQAALKAVRDDADKDEHGGGAEGASEGACRSVLSRPSGTRGSSTACVLVAYVVSTILAALSYVVGGGAAGFGGREHVAVQSIGARAQVATSMLKASHTTAASSPPTFSAPSLPTEAPWQALLVDLRASGALLPVQLGGLPAGGVGSDTGLVAAEDLLEGQRVGEIPASAALSTATLQPLARELCRGACSSAFARLVFGLAVERRQPRDRFRRYILALPLAPPPSYPSGRLSEPHRELLDILDPEATHAFAEVHQEVLQAGRGLVPPLSDAEASWAEAVVQSRGLDINGELLLLPGLDLINHDIAEACASHPRCSATACWVEALRDIPRGEQLTLTYGPWSNLALLLRYGFAMPRNPFGPALGPGVFARSIEAGDMEPWLVSSGSDTGCSAALVRRGPVLLGSSQGGVRTADLRCLFFERAFADEASARGALSHATDLCLPSGSVDAPGCSEPRWVLASLRVHAALAEECARRRGLFRGAAALVARVEAYRDDISAQLIAAAEQEFLALDACARRHRRLADEWHRAAFGDDDAAAPSAVAASSEDVKATPQAAARP